MPQLFDSWHHPRSISLSLHCWQSAFLGFLRLQATIQIAGCVILLGLGPIPLASRSRCYSNDDVMVWTALSTCHICLVEVVQGSFLEHWPLYFVLTLLLGEIADVARYGPYGGEMHLLCQGWYVWSPSKKQHLCFDRHSIGNNNAYCTTWLEF